MIQKTGDWMALRNKLMQVAKESPNAIKKEVHESGKYVKETMQQHIERQDLNWAGLSESTIKQKGSDEIYIDTGELKNSIQVRTKENVAEVSVSDSLHKDSNLTNQQVLQIMEYGTLTQPSRPLVQPTFKETVPKIKKNFESLVEDMIKK